MLKTKIAALLAAMMTITSLGTVAFAATENGLTYDKLLGNELIEGTFENGVNVGADRWVQKANVSWVMNNTHNGSAGAILVDQSASTVYSGFSMKSNRYYHAEAYIKLYNSVSDKAKLVLATKDGSTFNPITSTAVQTDVNGTGWTKLEGDFVRYSESADSADVFCYVELENEKKFYLDDVIIKDMNCVLPTDAELVSLSGETFKAGKLVAGTDGKASTKVSMWIEKGVEYRLSAWVMTDESSQAASPEAYMSYKSGRTTKNGQPTALDNEWKEVVYVDTVIAATGSSANRDIILNVTADANDIIYFRSISVQPVQTAAAAAEITEVTLSALQGATAVTTVAADSDTVALRYSYSVKNDDNSWTKIAAGHTKSGEVTAVPGVYLDSRYAGKEIKLEVEPMNADLAYGTKATATATVKAPFNAGAVTPTTDTAAGTVTSAFAVENTSGSIKNVAAVVAYYNANDEMIAIGIQNKSIANGDTEEFEVVVNVEPGTGDYSKLYLLDGATADGALALFPLAEAK